MERLTDKAHLKGSPNRDAFKHWHKTLPVRFYGLDIDFMLVAKNPYRVVAVLDYKSEFERIQPTFSEVIGYNELLAAGMPVFIVQSDSQFTWFNIWRYDGGQIFEDRRPPLSQLTPVMKRGSASDYADWEDLIRSAEPEVAP